MSQFHALLCARLPLGCGSLLLLLLLLHLPIAQLNKAKLRRKRIILVSPELRRLRILRPKHAPSFATSKVIDHNVPVETEIRLKPRSLQCERLPPSRTRLRLLECSAQVVPQARTGMELDFASPADRELFIRTVFAAVAIPAVEDLSDAASSTAGSTPGTPSADHNAASPFRREHVRYAASVQSSPCALPTLAWSRLAASVLRESKAQEGAGDREGEGGDTWRSWADATTELELPGQALDDDVDVFVGTWNVGGAAPPQSAELQKWVPLPSTPRSMVKELCGITAASCDPSTAGSDQRPYAYDMYVFGLQEIGSGSNRDAWQRALQAHLNGGFGSVGSEGKPGGRLGGGRTPLSTGAHEEPMPRKARRSATVDSRPPVRSGIPQRVGLGGTHETTAAGPAASYVLVGQAIMWEMAVWVFARSPHVHAITNVMADEKATGIGLAKQVTGKQLGNKGGLGVGLLWRDVPMAFVGCHLAARPERVQERHNDYRQIATSLRLHGSTENHQRGLDLLHAHEHVWWFGDVNYRVDLPFEDAVKHAEAREYEELLTQDQLRRESAAGRVLTTFEEGKIAFPPTYRWSKTGQDFSNKRGQAPSYTDRVFVRSLPGVADRVRLLSYWAAMDLLGSDHRAVGVLCRVRLPKVPCLPARAPVRRHNLAIPQFVTPLDSGISRTDIPALVMTGLEVHGVPDDLGPKALSALLHGDTFLKQSPIRLDVVHSGSAEQYEPLGDRRASVMAGKLAATDAPRQLGAVAGTWRSSRGFGIEAKAPHSTSDQCLHYQWLPADTAIPAIELMVWDPATLLQSHVVLQIMASSAGSGKSTVGDSKRFGFCAIPLRDVVVRSAMHVQSRVLTLLAEAGSADTLAQARARARARAQTDDTDNGSNGSPVAEVTGGTPPADDMAAAQYHLPQDEDLEALFHSATPFTGESVPFEVPLVHEGRRVGWVKGELELLSSTDERVVQRGAQEILASHWDFSRSQSEHLMGTPSLLESGSVTGTSGDAESKAARSQTTGARPGVSPASVQAVGADGEHDDSSDSDGEDSDFGSPVDESAGITAGTGTRGMGVQPEANSSDHLGDLPSFDA